MISRSGLLWAAAIGALCLKVAVVWVLFGWHGIAYWVGGSAIVAVLWARWREAEQRWRHNDLAKKRAQNAAWIRNRGDLDHVS